MKTSILFSSILTAALLGFTIPASAEEFVSPDIQTGSPSVHQPGSSAVPNTIEAPLEQVPGKPIPQSAAVVVFFPNDVEFDAGQGQSLPLTLLLAQPILDQYGNVVVPENSPVSAQLLPKEGGAQIVAKSLVVNGQLLPIQASSPVIPGMTLTMTDGNEQAKKNAPAYSHLGSSLLGAFSNGSPNKMIQGGLIGHGLGILSGLFSPQTLRLVTIPANSVYVLTTDAESPQP